MFTLPVKYEKKKFVPQLRYKHQQYTEKKKNKVFFLLVKEKKDIITIIISGYSLFFFKDDDAGGGSKKPATIRFPNRETFLLPRLYLFKYGFTAGIL